MAIIFSSSPCFFAEEQAIVSYHASHLLSPILCYSWRCTSRFSFQFSPTSLLNEIFSSWGTAPFQPQTPSRSPCTLIFEFLFSFILSASDSSLPHHLLVLHWQFGQFAAQSLVKVQVFCHTSVQTDRLAFSELRLFVMRRHALPMARVGHSVVHVRHHLHLQLCRELLRLHGIHVCVCPLLLHRPRQQTHPA